MEKEKLCSVVIAAQRGDEEAMNTLFNTYYSDVYYFALKTVKNADLACDITQESFVEIIRTLKDLKEPAAFKVWMRQVAYHQCTRYFKKKKDVLVGEDGEASIFDSIPESRTEFIPDEALDKEELQKTILEMLEELSEEQRAATMLYYYDELSVKQIAQIQNVSEGTVKSRLNYARKAVKKSVEAYERKNGIRLHSISLFPVMAWLFASGEEAMPASAAAIMAGNVATATGTTIAVTGTAVGGAAVATPVVAGATAKFAAVPLATKIVAGVTAATLTLGGVGLAVSTSQTPDVPSTTVPSQAVPQVTVPPTTKPDPTVPPAALYYVPDGCTYVLTDGTVLGPGEAMPLTVTDGDEFVTADYTYKYGYVYDENVDAELADLEWQDADLEGWSVTVNDWNQEVFGELEEMINGAPLVSMRFAFYGCIKMTQAPAIPDTVEDLSVAFSTTGLETPPHIPDSVKNMQSTFFGCTKLREAPKIPEGVQNLCATFNGAGIENAPVIPKSVTNLKRTFEYCSFLSGTVVIQAEPEEYDDCFARTEQPITLIGGSAMLQELAETAENGNVSVVQTEGIWSDDVHWRFDGATMTLHITGTGDMSNETIDELEPLLPYIETLDVGKGISIFSVWPFLKNSALKTVILSETVEDYHGDWLKAPLLERFVVHEDNPFFFSDENGVLYNKEQSVVVRVPCAMKGIYVVPETVLRLRPGYSLIDCNGLTEICIGSKAMDLDACGDWTYFQCDNLRRIWVDESNPLYCSDENGVLYSKDMTKLFRIPCGYQGSFTIPDGVTTVECCAADACTGLTEIVFSDSVKSLYQYAFYKCTGLTRLSLPSNLQNMGMFVFSGCSGIKEIYFRGNANWIKGNYAHCFQGIDAVAYYPANDETYKEFLFKRFPDIKWIPYDETENMN